MTLNLEDIPYQELNRFYAEVVSGMHVSLQPLATDLRVLRHEAVERHTENIAQDVYQPQYSFVPWMVAECFDVPNDLLLRIGKAWWLTIIDVVITDQMVDKQLPESSLIPLMLQHIRLHAERLYREAFGDAEFFWSRYDAAQMGIWNALAHETYCVDAHQQVYSIDEMQHVCKSRSDLIGAVISSMGQVSGQLRPVEALCKFYENLTFADQLLDDANDWKGDFASGRHTLPIVLAFEKENTLLENADQYTIDQVQVWVDRHRVLIGMADHATTLLEDAQTALRGIVPDESRLYEIVRQRLEVAHHAHKRYNATRLMTAFLKRLEG